MNVRAVLQVMATVCLFHNAETSLQIQANPPDINMVDQKPLTITCTYIHDVNATDTRSLLSLTLSKRSQVIGAFDIVSELTLSDPNSPTHNKNTHNVDLTAVSGHIVKDKGNSFLSVTWNAPSHKEAGLFACSAHTLNTLGIQTTETQETEVRDDSILVLGQKLKSLQDQIERQETCCNLATSRIAEFEVWRTTFSTSIKFFADNLVFLRSSEYKNRTYIVSNFTVSDITIAEAVCQTMGGYLVEVDDAQEWTFVTNILNQTHFSTFFIGGQDDVIEGNWYWMHSGKPLTFAPWNKGEPNNSGGENCLEIITSSSYVLNDISCTIKNRNTFICEIPIDGHT